MNFDGDEFKQKFTEEISSPQSNNSVKTNSNNSVKTTSNSISTTVSNKSANNKLLHQIILPDKPKVRFF